jgi:hypothetical protein
MKPTRLAVAISASLALLGTTSCQIGYEIDVISQHGRILFEPYRLGWFGRRDVSSVEHLAVRKSSQSEPRVWEIQSIGYNGQEARQIQYGHAPAGFRETVAPLVLTPGQRYQVWLKALGGAGHQSFVVEGHSQTGNKQVAE